MPYLSEYPKSEYPEKRSNRVKTHYLFFSERIVPLSVPFFLRKERVIWFNRKNLTGKRSTKTSETPQTGGLQSPESTNILLDRKMKPFIIKHIRPKNSIVPFFGSRISVRDQR